MATMTTPILEQCDKLESILRDDHRTQVVTGPAARNYTKALRQLEALITLIKKHERRLRGHDAVEQWITTAFRVSASLPMGRTTIAQNDALNARCAWLSLTLRRVHFALGHYGSVPEDGRVECLRGELHRLHEKIHRYHVEGMLNKPRLADLTIEDSPVKTTVQVGSAPATGGWSSGGHAKDLLASLDRASKQA